MMFVGLRWKLLEKERRLRVRYSISNLYHHSTHAHTHTTCTPNTQQKQKTHLARLPLRLDLSQAPLNLFLLPLVQYPSFEQGLGEGNRPLDVGCVHAFIVFERLVEFVHPRGCERAVQAITKDRGRRNGGGRVSDQLTEGRWSL